MHHVHTQGYTFARFRSNRDRGDHGFVFRSRRVVSGAVGDRAGRHRSSAHRRVTILNVPAVNRTNALPPRRAARPANSRSNSGHHDRVPWTPDALHGCRGCRKQGSSRRHRTKEVREQCKRTTIPPFRRHNGGIRRFNRKNIGDPAKSAEMEGHLGSEVGSDEASGARKGEGGEHERSSSAPLRPAGRVLARRARSRGPGDGWIWSAFNARGPRR
jgi:hypothetical protein